MTLAGGFFFLVGVLLVVLSLGARSAGYLLPALIFIVLGMILAAAGSYRQREKKNRHPCPHCREMILRDATKCPFCRTDLVASALPPPPGQVNPSDATAPQVRDLPPHVQGPTHINPADEEREKLAAGVFVEESTGTVGVALPNEKPIQTWTVIVGRVAAGQVGVLRSVLRETDPSLSQIGIEVSVNGGAAKIGGRSLTQANVLMGRLLAAGIPAKKQRDP